jgi:hypothetical protein
MSGKDILKSGLNPILSKDVENMRRTKLKEYLQKDFERGVIDHEIRVTHIDDEGNPHFYLHPKDVDGDTMDYVANGGLCTPKDVYMNRPKVPTTNA